MTRRLLSPPAAQASAIVSAASHHKRTVQAPLCVTTWRSCCPKGDTRGDRPQSGLFARGVVFQTGQPPTARETYGGSEQAGACSDAARLRESALTHVKRNAATGLAKGQGELYRSFTHPRRPGGPRCGRRRTRRCRTRSPARETRLFRWLPGVSVVHCRAPGPPDDTASPRQASA